MLHLVKKRYIFPVVIFTITLFISLLTLPRMLILEEMLRSGYHKDPDYPGEIRGTSCGECDDGVLQFKHSLRLLQLIQSDDAQIKLNARWALLRLLKHLPQQFSKYTPAEDTELAITVIEKISRFETGDSLKSGTYYHLFKEPKELLNPHTYKAPELKKARALFDYFCYEEWGGLLDVQRLANGAIQLISRSNGTIYKSFDDWNLNENTLSRANRGRLEVLPTVCIYDQEAIYSIVDLKNSFYRAVYIQNDELALRILKRDPSVLSAEEINSRDYGFLRYWLHRFWQGDPQSSIRLWLEDSIRKTQESKNTLAEEAAPINWPKLKKAPLGRNLLKNGQARFEQGDWATEEENKWINFARAGDWKHSVQFLADGVIRTSLRVRNWVPTGLVAHSASQCVALGSQRDYQVSATVEPIYSADYGGGSVFISWYKGDHCMGEHFKSRDILNFSELVEKETLSQSVHAGELTRSAKIILKTQLKNQGHFSMKWSNIQFNVKGYPIKSAAEMVRELVFPRPGL